MLHHDRFSGHLLFFTIQTLNTSTFRCIYRPHTTRRTITGEMSFEDFTHVIANVRSCCDVRIGSLHRDGERLLNKGLEAYIEHLTEVAICVTVSSNCSLLSEEPGPQLTQARLRMVATDFRARCGAV